MEPYKIMKHETKLNRNEINLQMFFRLNWKLQFESTS